MLSGKLLGGTSRVNNGLYSRAQPGEFAQWGEGWSYEELEPLFDRSERKVGKENTGDKVGEWSTSQIERFFSSSEMFGV